MKVLNFVSGNAGKISEVQAILGQVVKINSVKLDLPEYQGESDFITSSKCKVASELIKEPVIVEDTSLCFDALNGLPGPYIKWFLDKLGPAGLHRLLSGWENKSASALCTFAYCENPESAPKLFHGITRGTIVAPCGESGFGWDSCFLPDGFDRTYAEMTKEEKNEISHRRKALSKLKAFIETVNE
ncbi:inosine triphosphate pyrophosphatase [Parasteatoda tepidariorum]|uniref:inosine triphosphate pyrophosphatase n=1 Tax=Parasteatoda tepidariorum TaxID=114398 RepID=UPI00077FCA0C|nr:inosine triphosphate pyrophosphatase [Parasteatoda tepidariorum]XP_015925620.1 inosine triphosphate pyrophosphatase [Parasteatoda tepidariorum]